MSRLTDLQRAASASPGTFWLEAAREIEWSRSFDHALDATDPTNPRWFVGGMLNTCWNALDRHVVAGRGEATALVYVSAMTGAEACWSFAELTEEVARVAGMFAAEGVGVGDRVLITMPMVPEAVFAMLACARLGAVHVVVFGGFAAAELAKRIDDTRPKLVVTATCGIEPGRLIPYLPLIDGALSLCGHQIDRRIVLARPQLECTLRPDLDRDWVEARKAARPTNCVAVAANDPLYVLHTSGTTGRPKGVVRDNGGHGVALAWSMANVYGAKTGDVFWAASDIGWVVGHSYIVYAPLIAGCTTLLFEGKPVGTPDAGTYWRVAAQHGVDLMFTSPTALRAIRREDPEAKLIPTQKLGRLRALFLAGERADAETVAWAKRALGVPVIDHWWQTELGWPAAATCLGLGETETRAGSAGRAVPGYRFVVLGPAGKHLPTREAGDLAMETPLPPGCMTRLWDDEAGYQAYFGDCPGYYRTGDAGMIDGDGFIHILGRVDDIINVAGHRLSTAVIEAALSRHPDVAECAVIGAADELKGQVPVGLVVLKAGAKRAEEDIRRELIGRVRAEVGPIAAFRAVAVVAALPKTRSGKVLRGAMRALANKECASVPPTIEDPGVLDAISGDLRRIGFGSEVTHAAA